MAKFLIAKGLQTAYNALESKNADTIYVCTDTGNMYLGETALFEEGAFKSASLRGKVVTFTKHDGITAPLDLSTFALTSEVTAAIKNVTDIIGTRFTSSSTVSQQLAAVKATADAAAPQKTTYTKTEVDNKISTAVGRVYKVNGTKATFNELPTKGVVVGDVYNIEAEFNLSGKPYPAGTNVVASSIEPTITWDPLGGTVDLSIYETSEHASETYATKTQVAKDIAAAKTAVGNYTVNGKAISTNPVIGGGDVDLTRYTKPSSTAAIAATDSVNEAIGKLEKGLEDQKASSVTKISNTDKTISVTPTTGIGNVTVATVLSQTADNQITKESDGLYVAPLAWGTF